MEWPTEIPSFVQLVQLRETRRAALARAQALQEQLTTMAGDLKRAAESEAADTTRRSEEYEDARVRVRVRCDILEESLAVTCEARKASQHRRDQLVEQVGSQKVEREDVKAIKDALQAFADGAVAMFFEHFLSPVAERMADCEKKLAAVGVRLAQLQGRDAKQSHAESKGTASF